MYLKNIQNLKLLIKLVKPECIKLILKFIFNRDKSKQNHKKLYKFEGFKFKVDDRDFETKLTEMLEKFNKIELVQIANFLQIGIKETEKEIAHNMLSVLTALAKFSSSFESYRDRESRIKSKYSTKRLNLFNKTSKQKESELPSGAWLKENVSIENL